MTSSDGPEFQPPDVSTTGETALTGPDAAEWKQAHWAFIAIGALRNLRGWILPMAIFLLARGTRSQTQDLVWLGVGGFAMMLSIGTSLVAWWNYRYRVSDRDIALKSGIVSRQERVVPFERIQSVNLAEAPLERVFKVVRLQIDTGAAGSQSAEIELQAVTQAEATALRTQVMAARQRLRGGEDQALEPGDPLEVPEPADGSTAEGQLVRKLSTRELLIAGATSGRIGAAAAIAGALAQFGDDLVPRRVWERLPWRGLAEAARSVEVIAATVLTLGLVAWLISIIATVLTYSGFELRRDGEQLTVQHGLFDRRRTTIPIRRIQAVRIVEGMLRQPFGFAEVRFDVAGTGSESGGRGVLSPLLPRREIEALLAEACPEFRFDVDGRRLQTLPGRARRRYVLAASIGWVIMVAILTAITLRWLTIPAWWAASGLAVTPFLALLGNQRYRDAGWALDEQRFLMRWRFIARVTVLTQVRRLQFRELKADPLQRRASLVTFRTAVASGGMREGFGLVHLDREDGESLVRNLARRR